MRRALVGVAALLVSVPGSAAAQQASGWFWDLGVGWSWPVETRNAFAGGTGLRLGVGVPLNRSLSLRLAVGEHRQPYDDGRFGELFVTPGEPDAGSLGVRVIRVTGGLEWSPAEVGRVWPVLGTGLSYEHRGVQGLVTSPAWFYCSTATRFHFSTDPVTGRTTWVAENPTPEPGCADLRRDIDVEGGTFTMSNSLGLNVDVGMAVVGAFLEYSHGLTATLPGILSAHIVWRFGF